MKKALSLILALALVVCAFTGCTGITGTESTVENVTPSETTGNTAVTVRIGTLKGPTGMGMAYLMEKDSLSESKNDYEFTLAGSPDQITAQLASGELDIAAIPTNAAAALYNKTSGKVRLLAINTLGVLYILENGTSVKSVGDLKGKTLQASGQGSTAEYVLNYVLTKNGITPGTDITVNYASEHSEAMTLAATGSASLVMLPEPFVTNLKMKNSAFNTVIDLTAEWEKLGNGKLTMGCIAVNADFAENNPEIIKSFMTEYEQSVNFTNNNVADAAALIEKYDISTAAIAEKAIPSCNIVFISGADMANDAAKFLNVLYDAAPASIGGALPANDFYVTTVQ